MTSLIGVIIAAAILGIPVAVLYWRGKVVITHGDVWQVFEDDTEASLLRRCACRARCATCRARIARWSSR